jgi:hypothetical protein
MEMKSYFALLTISIAVSACTQEKTPGASMQTFTIPSDPKGEYVVLEKGGEGNERTIVTKREGPSGTTFSKRLYNCADNTVKYLGTGDSMAAMAASPADPNMTPIYEGSIAYHVGLKACM